MKYGIFSIDINSLNLGNRLIEWAVKKLLNLPEPSIAVSMFCMPTPEQIETLNQMNFIIVPGSTTLSCGSYQADALACLDKIKVPVYCVGSSAWHPRFKINEEVVKRLTPPLGVRDPWTYNACKSLGVEAILIGCPVMHLRKMDTTNPITPYTVIGFGREDYQWQKKLFNEITGKKISAMQEPNYENNIARETASEQFDYSDPEFVMAKYSRCEKVITGRLHGALPAVSQRKPVCFFGLKNDSRFSLLEHIGIKVNPVGGSTSLFMTLPEEYECKTLELRENFYKWIEKTIA